MFREKKRDSAFFFSFFSLFCKTQSELDFFHPKIFSLSLSLSPLSLSLLSPSLKNEKKTSFYFSNSSSTPRRPAGGPARPRPAACGGPSRGRSGRERQRPRPSARRGRRRRGRAAGRRRRGGRGRHAHAKGDAPNYSGGFAIARWWRSTNSW